MAVRGKLPSLNALRAFEAAARHVSFKAAALELSVTSTAISHQIRHLENLVGVKLFERTPRSISLTEAGRRLFPVLRDGFDRLSQAVAELSEASHSISISVTPAFAAKVLIPALAELRDAYPDMQLTIDATERLADVARGEVDLAVRYGVPTQHETLRAMHLVEDQYIAVAAPTWVGGRLDKFTPDQLPKARLLSYTWKNQKLNGPTWERWLEQAGIEGFDDSHCVLFSEESHAIQAAIDGAGVALASNVLVHRDLVEGRLVRIGSQQQDGLQFTCVSRSDNPKFVAIQQIEAWLAAQLQAFKPSGDGEIRLQ